MSIESLIFKLEPNPSAELAKLLEHASLFQKKTRNETKLLLLEHGNFAKASLQYSALVH
jgi:hypothetical protein